MILTSSVAPYIMRGSEYWIFRLAPFPEFGEEIIMSVSALKASFMAEQQTGIL